MNLLFKRPRGTQDVLPKDSYKWQFIEKKLLETATKYGFKEIRVPTFEHSDLFCRSVGDTSDIVEKEMYVFEDKSSRLITLRPEGTAGVVRAALENNLLSEALPAKLSYILSCFRYEKPESGRLREFHQFGVELFGSSSPQADYEVIEMAVEMLNNIYINNFILNINSIGCSNCREKYKQALINYMTLNKNSLCELCKDRLEKNPLRILDCKEKSCQYIVKDAPVILDFLCQDCKDHFENLKQYLDKSRINYIVNPKIVRGLDYYTKTVFEFVININGSDLTVCGGGRYDNLVSDLGGPSTPAFGFGMGLERLILILDNLDNLDNLKLKDNKCDIYIITLDEKSRIFAIDISKKLRSQGYIVETDLLGRSLKAQMKYANKISAKNTLVIGENEILAGKASLKNMETSEVTEFIF
ncbi:MAG: histidine--tRNA ligase [Oscillospiraceae bacterium]|nr:histidine--tRNA ligase [Oscillospiraceae bacterium]